MSSETIYEHPLPSNAEFTAKLKILDNGRYEPFVYIIKELSTGRQYIGCRTANNCSPSDMATKYFTSSNYIKEKWKEDISLFEVTKIYPCGSNHSALILEETLIKSNNAVNSKKYINRGFGGIKYNMSGTEITSHHKTAISEANIGKVMSVETRNKMSKSQRGKVNIRDTETGETFKCSVDDPMYISGRYVFLLTGCAPSDNTKNALVKVNTGKVVVRDTETGTTFKCSVDDPNYVDGTWVHANYGIKRSDSFKEGVSNNSRGKVNIRDTETGETFKCSVDDPMYISGRYVPANTGTFTHSNEIKKVLSEKKKGTVGVRDTETGRTFRCQTDDPHLVSGRYVYLTKGIKQKRVICDHCGKDTTPSVLSRCHGVGKCV